MEKKERNKALFYSIIMVLMLIVVTSSTVAFFAIGKSDNETIVGESATEELALSVSTITDVSKGLVPIKEVDITKGLKGEGSACIDANGNTVCQIYKLTVTNNSDVNIAVNGEVKLIPEAGLTNLRYALLTSDKLNIDGESKETSNVSLVSNDVINVGNSKEYYITIYLKDAEGAQDAEQGKSFSGEVTFYAAGGDMKGTTATFGGTVEGKERTSEEMLSYMKLTSNGEKTDFSSVATDDEGIFETQDDYGTSYYFRGAVTNNYVKFAGAYWRIIRINGDGTIRMIYDGRTSAHANGGIQGAEEGKDRQLPDKSAFNSSEDDNAYVGFMYGSTGQTGANAYANTHANSNPSTIKGVLDTWYSGLSDTNKGYIVDRVFCGDRTVHPETDLTGDGTAKTKTAYGARYRLESNKSPQLVCTNKNDKYTVSDTTIGNGALDNPVGLITADEVAMAGGVFGSSDSNSSYYLYTGQDYWTMSPCNFNGSRAVVFSVYSDGGLSRNYGIHNSLGVRPVVNLTSDITFSDGDGSYDAPLIVGTGEA